MRAKNKLVTLVLCALLMFSFALTAQAQGVTFTVSSNPNEVVHYGVTEVMGRVRLEATNTGPSVGSTITITYQGVTIKNPSGVATPIGTVGVIGTGQAALGIQVQGAGVFAAAAGLTFTSLASTGTGGQVILSIPAGLLPAGTANTDFIHIDGVRADVSTRAVGTDIQASLSSSPSTANTFTNVSVLRVATINESLVITVVAVTDAICINPEDDPTITVTEGSAGVMAHYVTSAATTAPPVDVRDLFGANRNTRVHIVVSPIPTDTTLTWPAVVANSSGSLASSLELISQSTDGDDALYEFVTTSQATSDANVEVFAITPDLVIDDDTDNTGTSTVQARLEPQDTPTSIEVPRFNHPYLNVPPDTFLTVNKCTTNLLFPFLTNAPGVGFDSGLAISNTSADPYGTDPQQGTITLYFWGLNAPPPVTTASVAAGEHYAASLSTIAPGFQGYVIAIAQFQYGHGFAFITGRYNSGSVFDVAEGYIANIIPDPTFSNAVRRPAGQDADAGVGGIDPPQSGESLGN